MLLQELEKLIENAIKKIEGTKENDLCRYLPGPKGGHIHHFTLRKLKKIDPSQLAAQIKKFITETEVPQAFPPRKRAPRSRSKENRGNVFFTRSDIEKVLELAHKLDDQYLLSRFGPKRPLVALKRELIRSIRSGNIEQELWNAYAQAANSNSSS